MLKTKCTQTPVCPEITQLSDFAIVELKSEPKIDTVFCIGSDIHQRENGSAETFMER